jgi:transcription elongation factor GreA
MSDTKTQYLSREKREELDNELKELKEIKIPAIAKRIDEAKQMGDLSENAEYHAAREDMAWAQSRAKEVEHVLSNAEVIEIRPNFSGIADIGSTVLVKVSGAEKEFTIVGPQEAAPLKGKISNESPLGQAFLGKKIGDIVEVEIPAGNRQYEIIEVK